MTLMPYVHFDGNAEEALNFYKEILNGEIIMTSRYGDAPMPIDDDWKNKLMHARLKFGNSVLYISDGPKNFKVVRGGDVQLSVSMDDENKIEEIFKKLAEGGIIMMPLAAQFWGARFGMLKDKFGISWMFNCELQQETSMQDSKTLDITV